MKVFDMNSPLDGSPFNLIVTYSRPSHRRKQ